jgi:hypothetical protein
VPEKLVADNHLLQVAGAVVANVAAVIDNSRPEIRAEEALVAVAEAAFHRGGLVYLSSSSSSSSPVLRKLPLDSSICNSNSNSSCRRLRHPRRRRRRRRRVRRLQATLRLQPVAPLAVHVVRGRAVRLMW